MSRQPVTMRQATHGDVPFLVELWSDMLRRADRQEQVHDLEPGDRLLLLTDGLVERRDTPLDDCLAQVAAFMATTARRGTEEIADAVLEEFGASDDDVALLVVDLDRA